MAPRFFCFFFTPILPFVPYSGKNSLRSDVEALSLSVPRVHFIAHQEEFLLTCQYVNGAGSRFKLQNFTAQDMRHAHFRTLHLPFTRLSPELPHNFGNLRHTRRADRMPLVHRSRVV